MNTISGIKITIDKQLCQLQESIKEYVKKHMGEKGYIDTQEKSNDRMYFYAYNDTIGGDVVEGIIKGVRVSGESLQFLGTENFVGCEIVFGDSDFKAAIEKNDNDEYASQNGDWENCWQDIESHDLVLFTQTLMSIADSIEQYGENENE